MTNQRGFTLIEMAIVLVIITILIGGLAVPLSAQIQARRIAETNKTLEEAREAIIGYAMANTVTVLVDHDADPGTPDISIPRHYLPCPDTDNDGKENRGLAGDPDACTASVGLFPWVTLATARQDAWGNHIRYAVAAELANSATGFHTPPIPVATWNQVLSSTAKCDPLNVDIAQNVPVVVVSLGANGRGARNISIPEGNATPGPPPATGTDELQNLGSVQTGCTTNTLISNNPSEPFDDLLAWVSFPQLISRICSAGGCP